MGEDEAAAFALSSPAERGGGGPREARWWGHDSRSIMGDEDHLFRLQFAGRKGLPAVRPRARP